MIMNLWNVYKAERSKAEFSNSRLYLTSRDRIQLSLSSVERYGIQLYMNQGISKKFSEEIRYVVTRDLTHDVFVSIYDVNTTNSTLLRFSEVLSNSAVKKIAARVKKTKNPNLEMRVIGAQDKELELTSSFEKLYSALKPNLVEIDLFGGETRHIVFDLKLGMSFNLLLLNRIYRPHELATTIRPEDYAKNKSELKFV